MAHSCTASDPRRVAARRTRRVWRPNAQVKTLFSEILNTKVRLRVTTAALRYAAVGGGLGCWLSGGGCRGGGAASGGAASRGCLARRAPV